MRPIVSVCSGIGLKLENKPGAESFQPLRVGHGDLHLQWQPVYQDVLRSVGPFAAFFPQAIFEGNGDTVTFSHCEEGIDILSKTRPLRQGEAIPEDEWERLDSGFRQFKAIANRSGIPTDVRRFIDEFTYPSHVLFPEAIRIYKPHWYSRRRLFILWGLEPLGGASFVRPSPSEARGALAERVETTEDKVASWFGRLLLVLLILALCGAAIYWIIYALLPAPNASFSKPSPFEKQIVSFENNTTYEKVLDFIDFGDVTYAWTFEEANPAKSTEEHPSTKWDAAGAYDVTLSVQRETVFGISRTSTTGPVRINVRPLPPRPPDKQRPVVTTVEPGSKKKDSLPTPITRTDSPKPKPVNNIGENGNNGKPSNTDGGEGSNETTKGTENNNPNEVDADKPADVNKNEETKVGELKKNKGSDQKKNDSPGKSTNGENDGVGSANSGTQRAPEPARIPIGSASIIWYGSRAYGINQPQHWVTLGIDAPPGYKAVSVTIDGKKRAYSGKFEQLVKSREPCSVEIEVIKDDSSSSGAERLSGAILFNAPFEVLNPPSANPAAPRKSGDSHPSESPGGGGQPFDPSKVPELSRGA